MKNRVWTPGVTNHFVERAVERMRCSEAEAREIGQGLIWAIENERRDLVQFVSRVNRDGLRVFQFCHAPTRRYWYALVDTATMACVSVLKPGFEMPRQGKSILKLREEDI